MAKRKQKRVKATEAHCATDAAGRPSGMVDVSVSVRAEDLFEDPPAPGGRTRDPELYELRTYGGIQSWSPTHKRAEQLRALYAEHVTHLEPDFGWKGAVEAVVPAELVADVREAMDFMGSLVDHEEDAAGGKTRLYSEGYYAHGF